MEGLKAEVLEAKEREAKLRVELEGVEKVVGSLKGELEAERELQRGITREVEIYRADLATVRALLRSVGSGAEVVAKRAVRLCLEYFRNQLSLVSTDLG